MGVDIITRRLFCSISKSLLPIAYTNYVIISMYQAGSNPGLILPLIIQRHVAVFT